MILYIAGTGRSGSTLLDRVLGNQSGYFSAGQLSDIWLRGLVQNIRCTCGARFRDCRVWQDILARTLARAPMANADHILRLQTHAHKSYFWRSATLASSRLTAVGRESAARCDGYTTVLQSLYQAIFATTGCKVIVDSSKAPWYLYSISKLHFVDIRVLHLVRDPRAVAYSWMRNKPFMPPLTAHPCLTSLHSAIRWVSENMQVESVCRSISAPRYLLRYEDFIRAPRLHLSEIVRWLELPNSNEEWSLLPGNRISFQPMHTLSGNINRFDEEMVLRPDDDWKLFLSQANKLLVTGIAWPQMKKYAYPIVG